MASSDIRMSSPDRARRDYLLLSPDSRHPEPAGVAVPEARGTGRHDSSGAAAGVDVQDVRALRGDSCVRALSGVLWYVAILRLKLVSQFH